jgi:hypothetical protein
MDSEHRPAMRFFVQLHLIPALLACIVFFTTIPFVESVIRIHHRTTAAIEWHGVNVVTGTVKPGDVLELVYTLTVNKQCPADLRAFIVAPDGTVPIRIPTIAGGYARPSEVPVEIKVKIPVPKTSDPGLGPLQSGLHTYRATATRYCPDGVEDDNSIPDATFTLEVDP